MVITTVDSSHFSNPFPEHDLDEFPRNQEENSGKRSLMKSQVVCCLLPGRRNNTRVPKGLGRPLWSGKEGPTPGGSLFQGLTRI